MKKVEERIRKWDQGQFNQLWRDAKNTNEKPPPQKKEKGRVRRSPSNPKMCTIQQRNAERATTLAQQGQFTTLFSL